jgi:hypothetical protein
MRLGSDVACSTRADGMPIRRAGVAALSGLVVELPGAWFAAQLGDGHVVKHSVDASVAAGVEAVPDGLPGTLARRAWQWCRTVEAGEATCCESSGITDLGEQFGG